jgi:2-oxo-4-hydroxy-4-carboxy-5-ureidoimidazoline decarboxylase
MPTQGALGLEGFNRLTERQRMNLLFGVCSSTIWARRVLAGGPFRDADALLDRADRVLAELPDGEIDAALDGHPRIGAKVDNASSAREQARVADADAGVRAELAAKNAEYDHKWCAPAEGPPRSCSPSSPTACTTIPRPSAA